MLIPRIRSILCMIDSDQLCILGGTDGWEFLEDGVILNHKTGSVVDWIYPESPIKFRSHSQSYMQKSGKIVYSAMDEKLN